MRAAGCVPPPLRMPRRRRSSLPTIAVCLAASVEAQYSPQETASALRWWCEPGREHEQGPLCVRWSLTDAIASANEESEKVARVDRLKAAIQAGQIDGQAVDATNPERHEMMDAWCADRLTGEDGSSKRQICGRVRNRKDFVARRDVLVQWWCGEQGHESSVKCRQMQFGKRVESTMSGVERKVQSSLHGRIGSIRPCASQHRPAMALVRAGGRHLCSTRCVGVQAGMPSPPGLQASAQPQTCVHPCAPVLVQLASSPAGIPFPHPVPLSEAHTSPAWCGFRPGAGAGVQGLAAARR